MVYKIASKYSRWVLITDSRFCNNDNYKRDLYGDPIVKQPIISNLNKE